MRLATAQIILLHATSSLGDSLPSSHVSVVREFTVHSSEGQIVIVDRRLVLVVQLDARQSIVLAELRDTVHLMALASAHVIHDIVGRDDESCLQRIFRFIRSNNVEVHARVVQHVGTSLKFVLLVKTVNLV